MLDQQDIEQLSGIVKASEDRIVRTIDEKLTAAKTEILTVVDEKIKASEDRITTSLRGEIQESEERIITKFNQEITDLADVNHLALNTLDQHKQRLELIEKKLELKPAV